jgi:hypothetical protein
MSNRNKMLAGACVLACLGGGGAIAAAGDESSGTAPASEIEAVNNTQGEPVPGVPADQAQEVSQLERPRTSDDAMPSEWKAELTDGDSADDHFGANPSLARRTGPGTWIVPADGYICVANTTPGEGALGFGCATPEDVQKGLLAPADIDKDGNGVLTGVLPDGVAEVTLADKDGSTRSVPVDRNTYRAAIDANLEEVRFTDAEGGEHVLPMAFKP